MIPLNVPRLAARVALLAAAAALLPTLAIGTGCYYAHLGAGQSDIVLGSESIDRALARKERERERLRNMKIVPASAEPERQWRLRKLDVEIERLGLVLDVRRYAVEEIGLVNNSSYTVYFDTGGPASFPTYVVSAAPKTQLRSVMYEFPIVGRLPYKGFFVKEWAEREAERLTRRGYDVYVRPASAYSTLGYFRDPVFTPMLGWRELTLIGTVIHEMLHTTVWSDVDAEFNESLAVFYERQGAIDYLRETAGPDHPRVLDAWDRWRDQEKFSGLMEHLRDAVRALYGQRLPYDETLRQRESIFREYQFRYVEMRQRGEFVTDEFDWFPRRPLNNAVLMTLLIYNAGMELYVAIWEAHGRSLHDSLPLFKESARHPSPRAFLKDWLRNEGLPAPGEAEPTPTVAADDTGDGP